MGLVLLCKFVMTQINLKKVIPQKRRLDSGNAWKKVSVRCLLKFHAALFDYGDLDIIFSSHFT